MALQRGTEKDGKKNQETTRTPQDTLRNDKTRKSKKPEQKLNIPHSPPLHCSDPHFGSWSSLRTSLSFHPPINTEPVPSSLSSQTITPSFPSPMPTAVVNLIWTGGLTELQRDHMWVMAVGVHAPSMAFFSRVNETWRNASSILRFLAPGCLRASGSGRR